MKFLILLSSLLLTLPALASEYHCNGKTLRSGSSYYHANGRSFKSGSSFYHPNGRSFKSGSSYYHPNGRSFKSGSSYYYANGRSFKSGSSYYHSNGRALKSGSSCYYDNGKSMGRCPRKYKVRDFSDGISMFAEIDFESDEVSSVGYEYETAEFIEEYAVHIPSGSVDYITSYCN